VLDPFLGSGTTVKAALEWGRNAIGYEINESFLDLIEEKLGIKNKLPIFLDNIIINKKQTNIINLPKIDYTPTIPDANPLISYSEKDFRLDDLSKVIEIVKEDIIRIDNGNLIKFLGIKVERKDETMDYLKTHLMGKKILIKNRINYHRYDNNITLAYIYLKNRIFINAYLIKSGLASPDLSIEHKFTKRFDKFMRDRENA